MKRSPTYALPSWGRGVRLGGEQETPPYGLVDRPADDSIKTPSVWTGRITLQGAMLPTHPGAPWGACIATSVRQSGIGCFGEDRRYVHWNTVVRYSLSILCMRQSPHLQSLEGSLKDGRQRGGCSGLWAVGERSTTQIDGYGSSLSPLS